MDRIAAPPTLPWVDDADGEEQGDRSGFGEVGLDDLLVRICRSPRNDGVLDAALLELLIAADEELARRDTDGETWLPRNPTILAERLGTGRKQLERAVARLLGHGFVHLGVDDDGTPWIAPDTAAVARAIETAA